jgi:hypothetical protein
MYEKPEVVRYGTFRELTLIGWTGRTDGFTVANNDGNLRDSYCSMYGCRS